MTLVVVRSLGLVTIQDLGRPGRMHEALPPGGALVRSALVSANRAAGNADNTAAIEILGRLVVRAESPVLVATDASPAPRALHPGEELTISSEPRRAAYLALRGGISAPLLLGGRSAHLSAGLGHLLRAGDRLESAAVPHATVVPLATPPTSAPSSAAAPTATSPAAAADPIDSSDSPIIRVVPGPDLDAFADTALSLLASAPYRILPTSDRVGTRLAGPPLPRRASHVEQSRPMVRGALEVPRDGAPIVLGPEHPTTGGYPILAVIASLSLDRFFSVRLGGTIRFLVA
jgi:allophanate hydrolase subunit 2